ncbi:MAG: nitroreductase family deazaflavin-dependent oxidoreductase [Gemmatimonadota bacterium]
MTTVQFWNNQIIAEFRANEGRVGGPFKGMTVLLLTHTGAKSGKQRTNPLVYYAEGDTLFIFGSKGGAATNPDWYHNLAANPAATIEAGTEKYDVEAEVITGPERDRIYTANATLIPTFGQYQKNTSRTIPVVALRRRA